MSTHPLRSVFHPHNVAVIGASPGCSAHPKAKRVHADGSGLTIADALLRFAA